MIALSRRRSAAIIAAAVLVAIAAAIPANGQAVQTTADVVYGQPGFTTGNSNNGGISAGSLGYPYGAVVDASGGFYISDYTNNRVLYYPAGSTTPTRVYGQLGSFTTALVNNGGSTTANGLANPQGLALDSGGNLFVADSGNARVLFFPSGTTTATRVYGETTLTGASGSGGKSGLSQPTGVAVDSNGGLYVSDFPLNRVTYYPPGAVTATRVYGQLGSFTSYQYNNGGISADSLSGPIGIGLDSNGALYVADSLNNRVLLYPPGETTAIKVYGQPGYTTATASYGGISPASLNDPAAVAVGLGGDLYIADYLTNRVLYYAGGSTVAASVFGQGGSYTSGTRNLGGISANSLSGPISLALDSNLNLYAGDLNNNRVLGYIGFPALPAQSITFGSLLNQTFGAAPFTVSATATSGLPVSFASLTPGVCTVSGSTVTLAFTGTCTIKAAQAGNASFSAAPPVNQSFTITQGGQTITFASIADQPLSAGSITATATSSAGYPVSLSSTTPLVCTTAGTTVSLLSGGTCSIQAAQAGSLGPIPTPGSLSPGQHFRILFVTSGITAAVLDNTSVPYYDAFATAAATSAGLTTYNGDQIVYWTGLVSAAGGPATDAINRLGTSSAPYYLLNLTKISTGNIWSGSLLAGIDIDENGAVEAGNVWTGTNSDGTHVTCADLGNTCGAGVSGYGQTGSTSAAWTSAGTAPQSTSYHVYAFSSSITVETPVYALLAASPVVRSFTVTTLPGQTISFGALADQLLGSTPPALSATASSGLVVSFASTTPAVCSVGGTTVTLITAGACTIQATQGGNASYSAATPVNQIFNITAPVNTPPTTDSVSPNSGSASSGSFVLKYSSVNGSGYLKRVDALFNGSLNGAAGCWVYYVPSTNGLYLFSNTVASIFGPLTPGAAGTLVNDQCTINGAGSSVTGAGNTLTLTLSINFTAYFRGLQTIYGNATDAAGLTSNWQTLGTWTSGTLVSTPPAATSVTPASGGGGGGSFTFNYSDLNGYSYMGRVDALFNGGLSATNGCYVIYWPATNVMFLQNDSATVWSAALTPGQAGTISNSQCSINGPASSVSGSGSTLSLTLAVSFKPGFAGTQTMFGIGYDKAGVNGGWQTLGTWNASGVINSPPTADSVSPSSGSATGGTFAFQYSSANGPGYLSRADALFNGSLNGAAGCWIYYLPGTNGIYLYSNTVSTVYGPLTPGASGTIQNDQCTINGTGTTVTGSGNTLTLNLNMTFNNYFRGLQTMYAYATDDEGGVSGWQTVGTWTTGTLVSTPPTAISITPSSGTGTSGTFTFNYSSVNGYSYMNRVDALFNGSLSGSNGCYVIYWPATNVMFLVNDAGTIWSAALTPGSPGAISNSQCTISGPASSVSGSGSTLSLTLAMSFSGSFIGSQTTFGIGYDKSGVNGGWTALGNWTP